MMLKRILSILLSLCALATILISPCYATDIDINNLQASDLKDLTQEEVIELVGPLFTEDQKNTGILASVSLAQFILESGYGKSGLTQASNNCFGMKSGLSKNNWTGSTWDGESTVTRGTKEYRNDHYESTTASFRAYDSINDSIADHSAYLLGAKKNGNSRYPNIKDCTDYRTAATIIKNGGYATSPTYIEKLCKIIEKWDLTKYDYDPVNDPELKDYYLNAMMQYIDETTCNNDLIVEISNEHNEVMNEVLTQLEPDEITVDNTEDIPSAPENIFEKYDGIATE